MNAPQAPAIPTLLTRRARGPVFLLFTIGLLLTGLSTAQTAAEDGQWDPPFGLPLIAIHAATLPTGDVLLFSAEHGVPGIHGWLLDPASLALTDVPPPPPWNPDCAGHEFLADGRLLVAGGTMSFNPLTGTEKAFVFNPWTRAWTQVEDMRDGRWYPSNVTLSDGRVITMAGLSSTPNVQNPDIERWDPTGTGNWQLLGQRVLPVYPLLHLLPDGDIFMAGPEPLSERYNPGTNTWSPVAAPLGAARREAPSVLLPGLHRVLVVGGGTGSGQPYNNAKVIDLAQPSPVWAPAGHMAFPRWQHAAILLPDGKVLIVGGRSNTGATNPAPVLVPEIYDPDTGTWDTLAPHQVPRMYHSTTVLLQDGRVLAAGGDYQPSGEIYSPPYLFRGSRPQILGAPDGILYGTSFAMTFTSATVSNSIVLIRHSSVTHSVNFGQRYIRLAQVNQTGGTVTVSGPSDGGQAPPGYYMLFVVDGFGVPSMARIVRVDDGFGEFVPLPGAVAGTNGLPLLTGTGLQIGGSPVSFGLSNCLPGVTASLVIGLSELNASFLGGLLVPSPDLLLLDAFPVGASGTASWDILYPPGIASGFTAWLQFWFPDGAAPLGYAASNGLRATAP